MGTATFNDIRVLHLEVTSRCNASCPMCARNQQGGAVHQDLPLVELKLEQIRKILPVDFIRGLHRLYLCGNFGDPAMASELIEILRDLRSIHPGLRLSLHSNGGARGPEFWTQLASLVDSCRFGIDGLKDTNHLYRQGVRWEALERNVKAFIAAGGQAEWDYLVFRHNEHQVEDARALAVAWGFRQFQVKSTSRFFSVAKKEVRPQVEVKNQQGKVSHILQPAQAESFQNPFYDEQKKILEAYGSFEAYWGQVPIVCKAAQEKSLYLTAEGLVFPCCWLGGDLYSRDLKGAREPLLRFLQDHGGVQALNAQLRPLREILADPLWLVELPKAWAKTSLAEGRPRTCARICGLESRPFERQYLSSPGMNP